MRLISLRPRARCCEELGMHFSIRHTTLIHYTAPVRESVMELRMQPRSEGPQALRNFQIATSPRTQLYAYTDHLGNAVYHFNVLREHDEMRLEVQAAVEMAPFPVPPETLDGLEWQRYNPLNLHADHFDYLEPSKFAREGEDLSLFIARNDLGAPSGDPMSTLRRLNELIYYAFDYEVGITEVHSPIEHALREERGVCQDFAHIMIGALRSLRLPARYTSGYLRSNPGLVGAEASHAWVSAFVPGSGWLSFDPTNDVVPGDGHVTLAWGRDYGDVTPVKGVALGGGSHSVQVEVRVTPMAVPETGPAVR